MTMRGTAHTGARAPRARQGTAALALLALLGVATACEPDPVRSTLGRPVDPVVVTGAQVTALTGAAPDRVVAFRASSAPSAGGWTQIPVQVDERLDTTVQAAYDLPADRFNSSTDIPVNLYADPGTFVGADPDPAFDADDEIAFMARDAGGDAGDRAAPAGTTGGVELRIADPQDAGASGYVYLFRSDGSLDPGAGEQYVDYDFDLLSGDYRTTYGRTAGPNPEDTSITGSTYTAHFADRWLLDSLTLTLGSKPGVDLLDRVKYRFPATCGRTEDTFDAGEGAFIVNKVGPVRGLRSYVGANSGPNTQATHAFYDMAIDTTIDLRVHAIPGVGSHIDLSRDAIGMTFRNPQVPNGLAVDGVPDALPAGAASWWTITGPQGGLGITATVDTNLALTPEAVFDDDETPTATQCTGDAQAIGESGAVFAQRIACTDPGTGCTNHLRSRTRIVATPAALDPAGVRQLAQQGLAPLTVTATPFG
jgi:hypothetical protein